MSVSGITPTIDAQGIHVPQYATVLDYFVTGMQGIFGADIVLTADSQDGQQIAIVAAALNDANSAAQAVYQSFSPATAQGIGLSSDVRINGLTRQLGSNSTCDVYIVGVAGTTIANGIVTDIYNNQWALPATVTIPDSGDITVTATCSVQGAITASIDTIQGIYTPVYGWQSVTNLSTASPGSAQETDAQLRIRQAASVAIPSLSILGGTLGAVEALAGVTEVRAYENYPDVTDSNGLPPHSISLVVQGGDATEIAQTILAKKGPGCATYGTTTENVTDPATGIIYAIHFYRPTPVTVNVAVTITALTGYTTAVGTEIKNAIAAYISGATIPAGTQVYIGGQLINQDEAYTIAGLGIGQQVLFIRTYTPANLQGQSAAVANLNDPYTYEITDMTLNSGTSDIDILFNQQAICTPADVTVTVS